MVLAVRTAFPARVGTGRRRVTFLQSGTYLCALPEGLAVRLEVLDFLRRGGAPEDCVAMGEAAEALDDVVVEARVLEISFGERAPRGRRFVHQPFEERDAFALHREVLGVLERHDQERALGNRERVPMTRGEPAARDRERLCVVPERAGGSPVRSEEHTS